MAQSIGLDANGLRFHALADGPAEGPLVLLLHGFPELAWSWRHQLGALAAAGYRVIAPDLRGFGRTELRGPYDLETLAADVAGLVRALGRDRAIVVGHDWGGAVAWSVAAYQPQVLERLVVMNCPHPSNLARELWTNPRQLARSGYMLFFQVPWLPEWLLARDRAGQVVRALRGGSYASHVWSDTVLEPYREAFADVARTRAALGYYRAAGRSVVRLTRAARAAPVQVPTLILWGRHDRFLGVESLRPDLMNEFIAPGCLVELRWIDEAGHFVQNEAPSAVNRELLDWLARPR
jgi:pimeloyl-ACP methyl ester carboxylesterase